MNVARTKPEGMYGPVELRDRFEVCRFDAMPFVKESAAIQFDLFANDRVQNLLRRLRPGGVYHKCFHAFVLCSTPALPVPAALQKIVYAGKR
jgi:hypothetical protein